MVLYCGESTQISEANRPLIRITGVMMPMMMNIMELTMIAGSERVRSQGNLISSCGCHEDRSIKVLLVVVEYETLAENVARVDSIVKVARARSQSHAVHVGRSTLLSFYDHKTLTNGSEYYNLKY